MNKVIDIEFDLKFIFLDISPVSQLRGFQFIKGMESKEFYCEDNFAINMILPFFKTRINQTNFHQNFIARQKLGKGTFAHVPP